MQYKLHYVMPLELEGSTSKIVIVHKWKLLQNYKITLCITY